MGIIKDYLSKPVLWPDGKSFAFTVLDDTDRTTIENGPPVYDFLYDQGFLTTKSVWPVKGALKPRTGGTTCADPEYLAWIQKLRSQGFEIALHNVTYHTSKRPEVIQGLEQFKTYFGAYPNIHINHTGCNEDIYWGEARLSGFNQLLYNVLTRFKNDHKFQGHNPNSDLFWGDICQQKIKYVRNFVYPEINTLKAVPCMPYFDQQKPYVNYWFASTNGTPVDVFNRMVGEKNQDLLEQEGGVCIMYTHFGSSFYKGGQLNHDFMVLMKRLSLKNGWFVPVSNILDYLLQQRGAHQITALERTKIELKWILGKIG